MSEAAGTWARPADGDRAGWAALCVEACRAVEGELPVFARRALASVPGWVAAEAGDAEARQALADARLECWGHLQERSCYCDKQEFGAVRAVLCAIEIARGDVEGAQVAADLLTCLRDARAVETPELARLQRAVELG